MGSKDSDAEPENSSWIPIMEAPVFTPRKLRVVCVGAGFSGLTLAYHFNKSGMEEYIDFTIYEKNAEPGGVWCENKYPGVAW